MKIVYYCYDHVKNPYCGGGGAYRDLTIHEQKAKEHEIIHVHGKFRGSQNGKVNGIQTIFLGSSFNYLFSRITYTLLANLHILFVKADVIVVSFSAYSPVLFFLFSRNRTIVEVFHLVKNFPFKKYKIFGVFSIISERLMECFSKNLLCINTEVANYFKTKYKKSKNVAVVYTGFNESLLDLEIITSENYIFYMGRIDLFMKGIDLLLDSFEKIAEQFPNIKLKIAGRGSAHDLNWLKNRISNSKFREKITFLQNVTDEEKLVLYQKALFVCMPSRFEGWCISAIEAAAAGKATIGSRISGLREAIQENVTGLLIESQNVNELSSTMKTLITDEHLRIRFGENGRIWAKNFTWEQIATKQFDFYNEVCMKNCKK